MAKKRNKKVYLYVGLVPLVMVIVVDLFLYRMEERNYQEKVSIIVSMINSDDVLNTATSLLKGEITEVSENEKSKLEKYGYNDTFKDQYKKKRNQRLLYIVLGSGVVYALLMALIRILLSVEKQRHKKDLDEIGRDITNLRHRTYDFSMIQGNVDLETEHSEIYIELESLGDKLKILHEQMEIEKEETKSLVTDISHQLKTPVAALKACFEILQQNDLSEQERVEFSMRCNQQLRGLENMLAALINISRMETGMIEINREDACIFDTFVDAINRVFVKSNEKNISIEVEAEDEVEQLKVFHDRRWLCEAFINIFENAIKYSPPESCITTRFILRTTFLRIEIEDQGIGIRREEVNQIFKRFYRGQSDKVKAEEGSGVGLYLTREIISRHGGTITVYSTKTVGKGSVFVIQIPYTKPNPIEIT